jgi:hemolysin activation/secretion protein
LWRIAAGGGWRVSSPYQLTLGGAEGVRGYHEELFPGARRVVLTTEHRGYFGRPLPDLLDLGFTLFADAGRIWGGDVPYGRDSPWRSSVGAGLRVGFPAGTRGVVRVDFALPIEPGVGSKDVVIRVSLIELLGVGGNFQDHQMQRSRGVTVGPDYFTSGH